MKITGRGASHNPINRFKTLETDLDAIRGAFPDETEEPLLRTEFRRDFSKSIVSENDSPDIGFRYSINPYRGCEHGCAYCYARPTHEYLGFSAGLDFESKIFVKEDAPTLLREKLMSKSWKGETIFMSGITDCYQPVERQRKLTRGCLEVLREFQNPFGIITKNALVTRDIDFIAPMAALSGALVYISITTLDDDLCRDLEPRTSRPAARLRAIRELTSAGIQVGVNIAPVIPGLNDHEIPAILRAARAAGATSAGFTPVRLPLTVLPIFTEWLERFRPERKEKVLSLIRDLRGGQLNDPRFGSRMTGEGPVADNLKQMFRIYSRREGFGAREFEFSNAHFRRPGDQLLFDFGGS
jgi:DNA repair photolyase